MVLVVWEDAIALPGKYSQAHSEQSFLLQSHFLFVFVENTPILQDRSARILVLVSATLLDPFSYRVPFCNWFYLLFRIYRLSEKIFEK